MVSIVPNHPLGLGYDRVVALPAASLYGIDPPGVVPGARLWLRGGLVPAVPLPEGAVSIGGTAARVLFAAVDRVAVEVPAHGESGSVPVRASWSPGTTLFVHCGDEIATGLHLVDSPAFDRAGRVYCAFSGPRGQETPVSVYRVGDDRGREPVVGGIVNATSVAFSPEGVLYVSSRFDGAVFRVFEDGRTERWASELGVACGLAFAPDGSLFVGDRTGTIHRLSADGTRTETFASLPPSIAAYHLAMGPDECLYVTGPTLATHDAVYRFDANGRRETIEASFGRPQGLAFDGRGVLHVVEALAGVSALYRLPAGSARRAVVAGPGLVGVAFASTGALVVATAGSLYRFTSFP